MLIQTAKEVRDLLNSLEQVGCTQLSRGTALGAPRSYFVTSENGKRKPSTISLRPEEYIALVVLMRGIGAPRRRVSLEDLQAATESLLEAIKLARDRNRTKNPRHPSTRIAVPAKSLQQAGPKRVASIR